tara:strand:+ start:3195 stop:3533 length:339 start_codon:yes stop_codon:yes gene_type:complete
MLENIIIVSKEAAIELKRIATSEGKPLRVRVAMQGGGCSGYKIDMSFTKFPPDEEFDQIFHEDDIEFVVDTKSATLVAGAKLDFGGSLLDRGFKWEFPKATGGCGCGTSFSF